MDTMKKRVKRKAVAIIIWHTVGIMESCLMKLGDLLRMESGTPVHRDSPLRGAMTEQEFKALSGQVERIRGKLENLRKIAKHIERNA